MRLNKLGVLFLAISSVIGACKGTTVINNYYTTVVDGESEEGESWKEIDPPFEGTKEGVEALPLDVFGVDGNIYWFDVSEEQTAAMNKRFVMGGEFWEQQYYELDDGTPDGEFADRLLVQTPDGQTADFGQIETKVVGQSTGDFWTPSTLPNLKIDADEFEDGWTVGREEWIRFNNGVIGSIFSEAAAFETINKLGYVAPSTSFAWVGGTPWQKEELLTPYTAVEQYKEPFCDQHLDFFGGGCANIWETFGADLNSWSVGLFAGGCELSSCDETNLEAFAGTVETALWTQEFDEATEPYLDWDAWNRFQCISWLLWIGDDYIHNANNIVLTEGADGKFRFLFYSVDISAGMDAWGMYSNIPLSGWTTLPTGCWEDLSCRERLITTCDEVVNEFEALDPAVTIIDPILERLQTAQPPYGDHPNGMLREGDEDTFKKIRKFYDERPMTAREELERLRSGCGVDTAWWDTAGPPPCDTGLTDTSP